MKLLNFVKVWNQVFNIILFGIILNLYSCGPIGIEGECKPSDHQSDSYNCACEGACARDEQCKVGQCVCDPLFHSDDSANCACLGSCPQEAICQGGRCVVPGEGVLPPDGDDHVDGDVQVDGDIDDQIGGDEEVDIDEPVDGDEEVDNDEPVDGDDDEPVDPCVPNPCVEANKTICTPNEGLHTCSCDEGYHDESGTCVENQTCTPSCSDQCEGADDGCDGTCPTNECTGCCSDNICLDGTLVSSCGTDGIACDICTNGQACNSGVCEEVESYDIAAIEFTCDGCYGDFDYDDGILVDSWVMKIKNFSNSTINKYGWRVWLVKTSDVSSSGECQNFPTDHYDWFPASINASGPIDPLEVIDEGASANFTDNSTIEISENTYEPVPIGTYNIFLVVDYDDLIAESDECNNYYMMDKTLTIK